MVHQHFLHAIKWNYINLFLYKIILQTHQACLFYVISTKLFGISGTIFSSIYFLISLTNFGFDYSLFALYRWYAQSKQHFNQLMHQYIIRFIVLCIIVIIMLYGLLPYKLSIKPLFFLLQYIPSSLLPFLISIFITESLKKSLEILAQLSFMNKSITILEICTIVTYISMVWGSYFWLGYINLYIIFIPMALTSMLEVCFLALRIKKFYITLPNHNHSDVQHSHMHMFKLQCINYINQLAKAFFSPNFLLLILAYYLGMVRVGYIKLLTDLIILLYMLLNRIVAIPSGALLASLPQQTVIDLQTIKATFIKITNYYIQFLYVLAITIIACLGPCLMQYSCTQPIITSNILLFVLAGFIEYLLMTYEKLFITQNASLCLAMVSTGSIIGISFILATWHLHTFILLPIILVRALATIIIALIAHKTWGIAPSLKMSPKAMIAATIISALCLFIHFFI